MGEPFRAQRKGSVPATVRHAEAVSPRTTIAAVAEHAPAMTSQSAEAASLPPIEHGFAHNFGLIDVLPMAHMMSSDRHDSTRPHAGAAIQREPSPADGSLTLQTPSLLAPGGMRPGPRPDSAPQLQLSPEFQAMALQHIQRQLDPAFLASVLSRARLGTPPPIALGLPPAGPTYGPPAPAGAGQGLPAVPTPPAPQPYDGDPGLREGGGVSGDLIDALKATSEVQQMLGGLAARAGEQWSRLGPTGKVGVVSGGVAIVGGVIGGILADPGRRKWAIEQLNGRVLPVPGVDWLHIEVNADPAKLFVGAHVDVGALLPPSWGFGPSPWSPQSLSASPANDALMPGQRVAAHPGEALVPSQDGDIGQAIRAAAGGGSPLGADTHATLATGLGADLRDVRIHHDGEADRLARAVDAVAFTSGQDIFFRAGTYDPHSRDGQRLLAHETIHTVQQAAGPVAGTTGGGGLAISDPADSFEREAERGAERLLGGVPSMPEGGHAGPAPNLALSTVPAGRLLRQPQSVADAASGALGVPITSQVLMVNASLSAGQVLHADKDATIHTVENTQISARITNSYITITFSPHLLITADSGYSFVPNPDLHLYSLTWDFAAQQLSWSMSAPNYAWLGGAKARVNAALMGQVTKLPGRIRTPGYDPFADPQLPDDIKKMFTGSGGGGPLPRVSAGGATAETTLGADLKQTFGSASLVVPKGTKVTLDVVTSGGIADNPAETRIGSVALKLSGREGGAQVRLHALDVDLPLIEVTGATLRTGGQVQLSYELVTEGLETAFRALVAIEAIKSGQADQVGADAVDGRQPKLHALIDAAVRQHIEPLVRQLILANRGVLSGVDLAQVLGVPATPGGQPPTP